MRSFVIGLKTFFSSSAGNIFNYLFFYFYDEFVFRKP